MSNWEERFLDLNQNMSHLCVHKEVFQRHCRSIGRMECNLLHYLSSVEDPVCMNDLAIELNVSHSRVTRIVDNLVNKGFVRRYPSEKDRRRWYAEITNDGEGMASVTMKENLRIQKEIVKRLPEDKIEWIYEAMKYYVDAFKVVLEERENF